MHLTRLVTPSLRALRTLFNYIHKYVHPRNPIHIPPRRESGRSLLYSS